MNRIRQVFGTDALLRILILLIGMIGMSIGGWYFLSGLLPTAITAGGFMLGWILRNQIASRIEIIPGTVRICLFIYGLVLFVGNRMEFEYITQLSITTATTALIFHLQFWSRSDPNVVTITNETPDVPFDK